MMPKEEREAYWQGVREEWLRKEAEFHATHEEYWTIATSGRGLTFKEDLRQVKELVDWEDSLFPRQKDEFIALLRERGTYLENHALMDWILEHGGKLWYRWAFRVTRDWRKK